MTNVTVPAVCFVTRVPQYLDDYGRYLWHMHKLCDISLFIYYARRQHKFKKK